MVSSDTRAKRDQADAARPGRRRQPAAASDVPSETPRPIDVDPYRTLVFPNRLREQRRRRGYPKLLQLVTKLPEIPYIRLSKIERGEVVARADELVRIATVLDIAPADLLVDVNDPRFDISAWAEPFHDGAGFNADEERFAVMLAAAMRARRAGDRELSIARLNAEFGIPPVILSRIENAQKTLDRWNAATLQALCRLFDVGSVPALRKLVTRQYEEGELDAHVGAIAGPEVRMARTRARIAELAVELAGAGAPTTVHPQPSPPGAEPPRRHRGFGSVSAEPAAPVPGVPAAATASTSRALPVYGAPLAGGLIALTQTGEVIEAPRQAGARSFGLKVCRPTLGAALPGQATVVVDPDRFPSAGGLAAVRQGDGYRLLMVTVDRNGAMKGYSLHPDLEVALDDLDPADVAAIISAVFV